MLITFTREQFAGAGPDDLTDALEGGNIVAFDRCPIPLPSDEDLEFMRQEMPKLLISKNISYHPELDKVVGIAGPQDLVDRTGRILRDHRTEVVRFFQQRLERFTRDWQIGTFSFRPLQERGRNLSAHASNELVHVDAGAYGATHGDGIVRFFVNVNPVEDRVWVTKGSFAELYRRFGRVAGIEAPPGRPGHLEEGRLDRMRSATARALSSVIPAARLLDSSPYDRAMRRFHNFMKDTPSFQSTPEGHQEFRFKPFQAWMVFTDRVSHACTSGQHAFIDTFIVRRSSYRLPELAPINILRGVPA